MKDFIIVGRGLAANVLAHTFHQQEISFTMIGLPELSRCSRVAAGIWNPIVFKRLTKSWMAGELIPFLNTFYSACEKQLGAKLITQRELIKPFTEAQEKTWWQKKSKNELEDFLSPQIFEENPSALIHCKIDNSYGKVLQAGSLDVAAFLDKSAAFLSENCVGEYFDHEELSVEADCVRYKNYSAKNIVFCEGHLVKHNPFFSFIPLKPVKGEVLTITASGLQFSNTVFNRNGFVMDVGSRRFKAGSTYDWNGTDDTITEAGKQELEQKLHGMLSCTYTTEKQEAGIRPSSIDRRPIVGPHPVYSHLFVFNGLGTKGVMLAPYFADNFVNFYQQKQALNPNVDVKRFYPLYRHDISQT